ncbi:MAG: hypothetical protein JWM61_3271 [Micrococcaceae bacterium]|jgi:hypothetical protein|nr:hypothetical protein [Micrococcaceae bacterium]
MSHPTPPVPQFADAKSAKAQAKGEKAYRKANRPFYKKKRFILLAALVIIIIAIAANSGGGGKGTPSGAVSDPTSAEEPAIVVSAQEMIDVLEGNALNAKNTYEGKRVTVSGFIGNIDASGDYFALDPEPDAFILTGIQVQTSEEFLDQVSSFSEGQAVTVTGTITNVGEVMGYSLEAETIE